MGQFLLIEVKMLPFLKPKKISSIIIARSKPQGGVEPMHEENEAQPELLGAAESLLSAIASKDAHEVAEAFQSMFQICESYPHAEAEHEGAE